MTLTDTANVSDAERSLVRRTKTAVDAAQAESDPAAFLERAREMHDAITVEVDVMARAWYRLSELLVPFEREGLYRAFGCASFKDYVEEVVRQPITSVRNGMYTYTALTAAGFDPDAIKDIRMSRAQDIAKVAKTNPPPEVLSEIVELARTAQSRDEVAEYRALVRQHLDHAGVEDDDWLRVRCQLSQLTFFRNVIDICKERMEKLLSRPVSDAEAIERILVEWYQGVPQK